MTDTDIPQDHPRRVSLEIRHRLIEGYTHNIVASAGLIAHGRGEAFDYMLGETTTDVARQAIRVALAAMLTAEHPVISVNGNSCALVSHELVRLSELTGAPLEVNLFYYTPEREEAIVKALKAAGAKRVLGTRDRPSMTIPELSSNRRRVDPEGIGRADVVLVPLEDGDRTEALRRLGKFVISIDLNPMSRTARFSNVTIVDNIVRAVPLMIQQVSDVRDMGSDELRRLVADFDNGENLSASISLMIENLRMRAAESKVPPIVTRHREEG